MSDDNVYIGSFQDDKFHGENEKMLVSNGEVRVVYQGKFNLGKTSPLGMILYQSGDIYYG